MMKKSIFFQLATIAILSLFFASCNNKTPQQPAEEEDFIYGGVFSFLKKMVDSGGIYKIYGEA